MGKASKFGLFVALGAVAGYVGSLMVSDKTRKKQQAVLKALGDEKERERVMVVFSSYTQESVGTYRSAKTDLTARLEKLGVAVSEIDKKKYQTVLSKTLVALKKTHSVPETHLKKLKTLFLADYDAVKRKVQK